MEARKPRNPAQNLKQEEQHVHVVGPRNLQNELLCHVFEREIGTSTSILEQLGSLPAVDEKNKSLLFVDTTGMAPKRMLHDLQSGNVCSSFLVALFNLKHGFGIEHEAIRQGVRGFFYQNESLDLLLKGVKLLFSGEIWLSHNILIEAVINGNDGRAPTVQERAGLTSREVEILALVATGADNKEIALKLFISQNTVKTHLYHIFQKIKVPSRLQAALWAANHLELTRVILL